MRISSGSYACLGVIVPALTVYSDMHAVCCGTSTAVHGAVWWTRSENKTRLKIFPYSLFYFPQWYFKSRLILFQINFIFTEFTACHPPQLRECIAAKIKPLRMERKRGELAQLSDVGYHISLFIFCSTPLCWPESLPPLVKLVKAWTSLSP